MSNYTGVRVIEVRPDLVNQIYRDKYLDTSFNKTYKFQENEYVVVKDNTGNNTSAITRHNSDKLRILNLPKDLVVSGVRPKNKEQWMAFDALLDNNIKNVLLTGKAGTGKTLLALAAALHLIEKQDNLLNKIILSKPMSQVGKYDLGALPGDVDDKFSPYLENYMCNIEHLLNGNVKSVKDLIAQYHIEFIPLQLIRGASWTNTVVIADEVQVLNHDEMVTLGTRMGKDSKLVLMGDMKQRDEKIARDNTGIHHVVNHPLAKASPLIASIDLIKCERSELAKIYAEIFER